MQETSRNTAKTSLMLDGVTLNNFQLPVWLRVRWLGHKREDFYFGFLDDLDLRPFYNFSTNLLLQKKVLYLSCSQHIQFQTFGWVFQTKVCLNFFTIVGVGAGGLVTVLLQKMKGYSIVYCTVESTSYFVLDFNNKRQSGKK